MNISSGVEGCEDEFVALFRAAFAASEGPDEGERIGALVTDLLATTPAQNIWTFRAHKEGEMVGAVAFTRLHDAQDPRSVVLLSPMAVAPDRQRQGIGQAVINHALSALTNEPIDVAITYGDPKYYGKVRFMPISQDVARAPLPLSFP
ncbi:MAG: GNAT family N-acetyltransferase, partial [Pseudomonadota bacterium]